MVEGLAQTALPVTYIQAIQTRAEVSALIAFDRYIDLVILRGSDSLVIVTAEQRVVTHATPSSWLLPTFPVMLAYALSLS